MNGRTHTAIGAASMAGAALIGVPPPQCVLMVVIAAGAALGPDLDHPGSTASRAMPSVVHKAVRAVTTTCWKITSTGRDAQDAGWKSSRGRDPYHRTFTHTTVASVALGLLILLFTSTFHIGIVALVALMGWWLRRITKWENWFFVALGGVMALAFFHPMEPWMSAWAVFIGYLSHVLADGCTKAGVPFLWPLKIKGKRWWNVRLLGSTVTSGQSREWLPATGLAIALNAPFLLM